MMDQSDVEVVAVKAAEIDDLPSLKSGLSEDKEGIIIWAKWYPIQFHSQIQLNFQYTDQKLKIYRLSCPILMALSGLKKRGHVKTGPIKNMDEEKF